MLSLLSNKRHTKILYLVSGDNSKISYNSRSSTKMEVICQQKMHSQGVSPQIYDVDVGADCALVHMEYINNLNLYEEIKKSIISTNYNIINKYIYKIKETVLKIVSNISYWTPSLKNLMINKDKVYVIDFWDCDNSPETSQSTAFTIYMAIILNEYREMFENFDKNLFLQYLSVHTNINDISTIHNFNINPIEETGPVFFEYSLSQQQTTSSQKSIFSIDHKVRPIDTEKTPLLGNGVTSEIKNYDSSKKSWTLGFSSLYNYVFGKK